MKLLIASVLLSLTFLSSCGGGGDDTSTPAPDPTIDNQSADSSFAKFESISFSTNQEGEEFVEGTIGDAIIEFQKTHFDASSGQSEYVGLIPNLAPGEQVLQVTIGSQLLNMPITIVETNLNGMTENAFIKKVISDLIDQIDAELAFNPQDSQALETLKQQVSDIDVDAYTAEQLSVMASLLANNIDNNQTSSNDPALEKSLGKINCFKPAGTTTGTATDAIIASRSRDELDVAILEVIRDSTKILVGSIKFHTIDAFSGYAERVKDCFERADDPILQPIDDVYQDENVLVLEANEPTRFNTQRIRKFLDAARSRAQRNIAALRAKILRLRTQAQSELKPLYANTISQLDNVLSDIRDEVIEFYEATDFTFDLESNEITLATSRSDSTVTFVPEMHIDEPVLNTTLRMVDETDEAATTIPIRFVQNLPVACPSDKGSFECSFAPDAFQVVVGSKVEAQLYGEDHIGFRVKQAPEKGTIALNAETGEFSYTVNPEVDTNTRDFFTFVTFTNSAESIPVRVDIGIAAARYGLIRRRSYVGPELQNLTQYDFGDRMVQPDLMYHDYGLIDLDTGERLAVNARKDSCDGDIWMRNAFPFSLNEPNIDHYFQPRDGRPYPEDQYYKNFKFRIFDCDHDSYVEFVIDLLHKKDALRFIYSNRIVRTINFQGGGKYVATWNPDSTFTNRGYDAEGNRNTAFDRDANFYFQGDISGLCNYDEGDDGNHSRVEPISASLKVNAGCCNRSIDHFVYFRENGELVTDCNKPYAGVTTSTSVEPVQR